jgi:phosphoglycolate phosphatase-like HAD superfamily hydrolase
MPWIDAVIFDLAGVLIDARHLHYEAFNAALSPFGLEISHDAHLANFDGLSTRLRQDREFLPTLILDGTAEMCDRRLGPGDIIKLSPGEASAFSAITDVTTVVVKLPSVTGDKYAA